MESPHRKLITALLTAVVITAGLSCSGDRVPTGPRLTPPPGNAILWDGSQASGNQNVFFLPPLVSSPVGTGNYGKSPFQPGMPVEIEIRCMPQPNFTCANEGMKRAPMAQSQSDEQYMFNWDTKATGFDAGNTFRLFVWIGATNVAYADVVLIANAPPKNKKDYVDIALPDGRTMPIKVRVQQGWNCVSQASCVTKVVTNTPPVGQYTYVQTPEGASAAFFPKNWFDTKGGTISQVLVTIEDVTAQYPATINFPACSLGGKMSPSQAHCVRFTVDPKVTITTPPCNSNDQNPNCVVIATCIDGITGDHQQLVKYDEGETPLYLQNVRTPSPFICHEGTSGISSTRHWSNPAVNLAMTALARVGHAVQEFLTPKRAYAIDLGVGGGMGLGGDCCSLVAFDVAKTATNFTPLSVTGPTNTAVPDRSIRVSSLHDGVVGLLGISVTCKVEQGGGYFGTPGTFVYNTTTNSDGIASCAGWVLGGATGTDNNEISVTVPSIPDCNAFEPESDCNGAVAVQSGENGLPLPITLQRTVYFTASAVEALPDLALDRRLTASPLTVHPGETVTVDQFNVQNRGAAASPQVDVSFVLSISSNLSNPFFTTSLHTDGGIAVGGSSPFLAHAVTVPVETPPGTYYLGLRIDPNNAIRELDETNNTDVITINVTAAPSTVGMLPRKMKSSVIGMGGLESFAVFLAQ